MDPHVPSNPSMALTLIMAFLIFITMAIRMYNNKLKLSSNRKLPPGPKTLPIIGNMHQLISSLPHRRLADLAEKHGPVMYLKLGEVATVVISSRQAAEEALRNNDLALAYRPATIAGEIITYNFRDIALAPYGDYWRQMRKIFVVHLTSSKQVESLRLLMEAEVNMFIRSIVDSSVVKSPVNLTMMLHSLTTSIISKAAFGESCKQADAFAALVTRISETLAGFSVADFFPSVGVLHRISKVKDKVLRLHQEVDDVLEKIICEYRASKEAGKAREKEILNVLLDLQDQGEEVSLSMESIKAILVDVFTGGIETSATLLEWTMSEILRHPEVMRKVQAEVRHLFKNKSSIDEPIISHQLDYMHAIIKETMRLHPPLPLLLPREAHESLTINGYEIPCKAKVFINAWKVGRDPEVWTDAEKFYPERFLEISVDYKGSHIELIPFGAGRRMCPGMMFGVSTVELTLANMLYHFDWELPDGLEPQFLDMSEIFGVAVGRKHDLCLIATQRHP